MTGLPEIPTVDAARERAEKALSVPLGFASPLWVAFGAAASMGVAWWWMTRWSRAVNLEAMLAASPLAASPVVAPPVAASTDVEPTPDAAPAAVADMPTPVAAPPPPIQEPVRSTPPTVELKAVEAPPTVFAAPPPSKAVAKPVSPPAPDAAPDDLTRLVGIGAKLAAALAERGVTRFEHIAKWKEKDLARVDADLKLLGRATRDAWVAQAKRFAAES